MYKIYLCLCLLLGAIAARGQKTVLTFEIMGDATDAAPHVVMGQQTLQTVASGAEGRRTATLSIDSPAYVKVYFSKLDSRLCYVEPGKTLVLRYDAGQGSKSLAFGGSLAKENEYLQRHKWTDATDASLPPTFAQWEKKREETFRLERYLHQPVKDTAAFMNYAHENFVKDASWLRIPDYLRFIDQYIRRLVKFQTGTKQMLEGTALADMRLSCIEKHITQPDIKGYLVDITLFHLAEQNIPRYNDIYRRYVKDAQRLALYDAATRKAEAMAAGKPCPDFTFSDSKGGKVSLADLRGQFVYIDLWATWCGPCKGEMPALLDLERRYEGKDILFVSISIDRNKDIALWKKTITQMGLKGIQLHLGEQWEWLKTFMPSSMSVPRFILLDREGRIIDAHAPLPSDKRTAEMFDSLLSGNAASAGISFFKGSYEDALKKAAEENKLLFIDCYADWCGPCHRMAKEVFTQQKVGEMFNRNFICLMCNMEKDAKGKALRGRFNVVSYPTLLFVSPEGFVTQRRGGYTPADTLLAFAQQALETGSRSDEQRFAGGERDETFLKKYLRTLCDGHQADTVEKMLETLYGERGAALLDDADYWKAYVMCACQTESPLAKGFVAAYGHLSSVHGEYAVKQKVRNLFAPFSKVLTFYDTVGRKEQLNEKRMKAYLADLKQRGIPGHALLAQELQYLVMLKEKDYERACRWGEKCLKRADARTLCNWAAWGERMVRDNAELRRQIAVWADRAVASADGNAAIITECENVKRDLLASPSPVISFKGKNARTTIPIRGY